MEEIVIRLDEKVNKDLEKLATKIGVTKNSLIKIILFKNLCNEKE